MTPVKVQDDFAGRLQTALIDAVTTGADWATLVSAWGRKLVWDDYSGNSALFASSGSKLAVWRTATRYTVGR